MCDVVWAELDFMGSITSSLANNEGICQSSRTRGDVNRSTTGEVEATQVEYPSSGIPRPAGYWVVDEGRPNKHKDDAGGQSASLCDRTSSQRNTNMNQKEPLVLKVTYLPAKR